MCERLGRVLLILIVIVWRPYSAKSAFPCYNYTVETAAGAVDDLDVAVLVPSAHDANVIVSGVAQKSAGPGLAL